MKSSRPVNLSTFSPIITSRSISTENVQLKAQIEKSEKDSINLRLPIKGVSSIGCSLFSHRNDYCLQIPIKFRRSVARDPDEDQRKTLTNEAHQQEEAFRTQTETMKRELNEVRRYLNRILHRR